MSYVHFNSSQTSNRVAASFFSTDTTADCAKLIPSKFPKADNHMQGTSCEGFSVTHVIFLGFPLPVSNFPMYDPKNCRKKAIVEQSFHGKKHNRVTLKYFHEVDHELCSTDRLCTIGKRWTTFKTKRAAQFSRFLTILGWDN
jgi:hypothetical protein